MNPLIKKFEEVYGKKPEEGGMIEQIAAQDTINLSNHLPGGVGADVISLGGDTMLTSPYISSGRMTLSSFNSNTLPSFTKSYTIPHSTEVEKQFGKVMEDVGNNRATVASINAEIDQSFTGFGGQIRYTIEIVGTYP